jgi:hypothetical protein
MTPNGNILNFSDASKTGTFYGMLVNGRFIQSGTAGYTIEHLVITDTSTGTGTKLIADKVVNGSTIYSLDASGNLVVKGTVTANGSQLTPGSGPVGSGTELQARSNATTFQALTGSAVNGSDLSIGGALSALGNFSFTGTGSRSISMPASDTAGDMSLVGRASSTATGGAVGLTGGSGGTSSAHYSTAAGGPVNIKGGQGGLGSFVHGDAGPVNIAGGDATGSSYGNAGGVSIAGGTSSVAGTAYGPVTIKGGGGTATSVAGADVTISGGNGNSGNATGGNVVLQGGTGNVAGQVKAVIPTSDPHVVNALYTTAGVVHVSAG